ncbi:unnamed protein product [Cercopithifilaria johnstoni]|uniref:Uncharacterized protein n=1 Tax=Cercopithifilaria johnstoni TaxID=2874296 RepID=A0A8J2QAX0_9BILA|nr:unnamed protein product [Cercopithifilaria johnstoni]
MTYFSSITIIHFAVLTNSIRNHRPYRLDGYVLSSSTIALIPSTLPTLSTLSLLSSPSPSLLFVQSSSSP